MKPTWHNVFGEEVDLDNIDREYALNILCMQMQRFGRWGLSRDEIIADPLTSKLRDIVLTGRKKNFHDRRRAAAYNIRCKLRKLPYRA